MAQKFLIKFVILLVLLSAAASAQDVVEVKLGEDVVLHCEAGDVSIRAVEWTRPDLESEEYVFFYRRGREVPAYQHPSFRGRVELVDKELKNGDVSVKLKNVTINDAGTYECRVAAGSRRRKRDTINDPPISSIRLKVKGPEIKNFNNGNTTDENFNNGNTKDDSSMGGNLPGLFAGLAGFVLVCLIVVGLFVGLKYKKQTEKKPEPADDEGTKDQLV